MKLRHEHSITSGLVKALTNIHDGNFEVAFNYVRECLMTIDFDIQELHDNDVNKRKNEIRTQIVELQQELYSLGDTE